MVSLKVAVRLDDLVKSPEEERKKAGYAWLLEHIQTESAPDKFAVDLKATVDAMLGDSLGIVVTRGLLQGLHEALEAHTDSYDAWIDVGMHTLGKIAENSQSASSYVDQATRLRELVATAHENNEDFVAAAQVLAEIPLDSSQRRVGDGEKARLWVRLVRNYLEVDDSAHAEASLNKLKNVI